MLFSCASQQKANPKKLAKIYSKKGTSDLINKEYTEALGNLIKAYQYNPEDDEINTNLGMAYYFKRNTAKAVIHLKKALEINPKNIDAKMNIATIYMNMGQLAKAEEIYLNSIKTDLTYRGHFRTYYNLSIIEEKNIVYNWIQTLKLCENNYVKIYHWGNAEKIYLLNLKKKYTDIDFPKIILIDLLHFFRSEPIIIKDCFNFGLKSIGKALYKHNLIKMMLLVHVLL